MTGAFLDSPRLRATLSGAGVKKGRYKNGSNFNFSLPTTPGKRAFDGGCDAMPAGVAMVEESN